GFGKRDVSNQFILSGESEVIKEFVDLKKKTINKKYTGILIVQGCRFPQEGVTEFEVDTFEGDKIMFTLNYDSKGDASSKCDEKCDCIASLIMPDGAKEVIDLSQRWWNKTKKDE
ncbi:MAG: hypothetical protein R3182_06330, partial [Draconibacterium sp.]|nr:hypothetical protein [Draconibacterium sp.]